MSYNAKSLLNTEDRNFAEKIYYVFQQELNKCHRSQLYGDFALINLI